MSTELAEFLKAAEAEAGNYEPCMSLYVDQDGKHVQLLLDSARNYYGQWIRGEGGDIALLRDRETDKVVGAVLPLYNAKLSVWHSGELRINEGFRREGA